MAVIPPEVPLDRPEKCSELQVAGVEKIADGIRARFDDHTKALWRRRGGGRHDTHRQWRILTVCHYM